MSTVVRKIKAEINLTNMDKFKVTVYVTDDNGNYIYDSRGNVVILHDEEADSEEDALKIAAERLADQITIDNAVRRKRRGYQNP